MCSVFFYKFVFASPSSGKAFHSVFKLFLPKNQKRAVKMLGYLVFVLSLQGNIALNRLLVVR